MNNLSRRTLLQGGAALMAVTGAAAAATGGARIRLAQEGESKGPQIYVGENEFSDGPSEAARRAVAEIIPSGGRYLDDLTPKLIKIYGGQLGVPDDHISLYPGSFVPLNYTSLAFTSPTAGLVAADPTFTVGVRRAQLINSPVYLLPLRSDYTHDTEALTHAAHEKKAGLLYINSPNNPTGTVTPRAMRRTSTSPTSAAWWIWLRPARTWLFCAASRSSMDSPDCASARRLHVRICWRA
jgi:histidinol-phosphate aminotransferase